MTKVWFCAIVSVLAAAPRHAKATVYKYDIKAFIDGFDFLLMRDSTLQWHHTSTGSAAVGRHGGNDLPTDIKTFIDDVPQLDTAWTPVWPKDPPAEIRFDAFSDMYPALSPALPPPDSILSIEVEKISGRGSVSITQFPDPTNFDTFITRFNDGFAGSAFLDVLITVTTPEPGSLGLVVVAACAMLKRRAHQH